MVLSLSSIFRVGGLLSKSQPNLLRGILTEMTGTRWIVVTSPGGRVVSLDENSCNKILNDPGASLPPRAQAFRAASEHLPLVIRATSHFTSRGWGGCAVVGARGDGGRLGLGPDILWMCSRRFPGCVADIFRIFSAGARTDQEPGLGSGPGPWPG